MNATVSRHDVAIELRARDFDGLGHLTAAAYLELLEEARVRWLGPASPDGLPGYVVARQVIDYLREIRPADGPLRVRVEVSVESDRKLTVREVITGADDEERAVGTGTLVAWDRTTRRSRALTRDELAVIVYGALR